MKYILALILGVFLQQDVLGLYVAMQVAHAVQQFQPMDDLSHDFGRLLELEYFVGLLGLGIEQIASVAVLTDEILIVLILLEIQQLHDVLAFDGLHAFFFALQVLLHEGIFLEDLLGDHLDCDFLAVRILHQQHIPVGALPQPPLVLVLPQNHAHA